MRYPLEPLAQALRIQLHRPGRPADDDQADAGLTALADRIGVTPWNASKLLARGLNWEQADVYATRTGLHPGTVWPEWWSEVEGDHDWYGDDPALESLRPKHGLTLIRAPRATGSVLFAIHA